MENIDKKKINYRKKTKNNKSNTPVDKTLRNTNYYFSNKVSSENTRKRNKTNIRKQTRNINNKVFSNYTKSCCHSTNNIIKNKNNIINKTTNNFRSNKKININDFCNYNNKKNNKRLLNLRHKLIAYGKQRKYDISYNSLLDKSKSLLVNYNKEENNKTNNRALYNIKEQIIKNNKKDIIKQNNIFSGINKNKLVQKIKSSNKFINVMSAIKNKNKNNENNRNIKIDNDAIILANSKRSNKIGTLTSPSIRKTKQKVERNDSSLENKLKIKNKNSIQSNNKRIFESSAITYRLQSPIMTRDISESPRQLNLNEKTRNKQLPWKIKKKGIDEKKQDKNFYQEYIHKIKNNPFIIKNKIVKKIKNKNINVNSRASSNNKQINESLNKSKSKNKTNKMNVSYSKDNLYKNILNLNSKLISPNNNQFNKSRKQQLNEKTVNCFDLKFFPLKKDINKKYFHNPNKRLYRRNIDNFGMGDTNNTNNNNFTNNFTSSIYMNSHIKEKQKINKDIFIFDLSCIIIGKNNIKDCCINLVKKFMKNGVCYSQEKNNIFNIHKNGVHYEIEIFQLFDNEDFLCDNNKIINNDKKTYPFFYYKIIKRKGNTNMNKFLSKVILSP